MSFFFHDTATTEISTLSLHDALPISGAGSEMWVASSHREMLPTSPATRAGAWPYADQTMSVEPEKKRIGIMGCTFDPRSEEHTSELQSHVNLVCRLLLEKKRKQLKKA